ncbi:Histidinol dehydrogenase [subsurface metagenome]
MPHELDKILISYEHPDFESKLSKLRFAVVHAARFRIDSEENEQLRDIVKEVMKRGDKAVAEYTGKFDGVKLTPEQFCISHEELEKAHKEIDKDLLTSIRQAIENVKKYQKEIFIGNDKKCFGGTEIKYTPIRRVGVCVPGASAPLPSTVIMTVVPAMVAGVKEIAVVSPPRYKGDIHPVTLAVCYELSIDKDYQNCQLEVYRIGGAQAVAALARGTDRIRKVYKIVGPGNQWVQMAKREAFVHGNQWVQMAKREVFGLVDIDSVAGPSEVLIIADDKANPAWVAADMLSQAEHAPGSAIVFTHSQKLANEVLVELKNQVNKLSRAEETIKCLEDFGGIVLFDDMARIIECANDFASEHLEIQCGDKSREIAEKIDNAGAIFIGDYSPVAVGDYWAGPSHTLPTGMTAKFFSPLSSNDFIKSTSIIEYDKEQLAESAEHIIRLAEAEGLDAHAKSIKIRQQDL